jgi:N6-L-threonylcarbamoyladenine synthase
LRNTWLELGEKHHVPAWIPAFEYCTDNAAMVAMAGYQKYLQGNFTPLSALPFARNKH